MARFYGEVGFSQTVETSPSVWEEKTVPRKYYGDVMQNYYQIRNGGNLNDDIDINNKISIVADSFAKANYGYMRYIKWNGVAWKINSVEVEWPRLILTLGGVYNGEQTDA